MSDKSTGDLWGETGEQVPQAPSEQNVQATQNEPAPEDVRGPEPVAKPTPQESFQEIRSRADKLQRERDEALLTLQRIEQYALQQQQQAKQPEPEPAPAEYDDDDYIEGKQFKNEINYLKRELNQFKQQAQSTSVEQQLRNKYNDFDKVMTYENIAKLRELRPEIASSLHQSSDLYNKAAATYTILKELGIHQENTYHPERERAELNTSKPQASSSLKKTESALSHASEFSGSRLDESRKKEIWQQMQKNLRG